MSALPTLSCCPACSLPLPFKIPLRTPRVDELLRTNSPPRDNELVEFRHIVESGPEALSALDQQIAQARELLDKLLLTRAQAESRLNDAKALVNPIRTVPNEILLHIFTSCVTSWFGDGLATQKTDSLDPRVPPWTLTHVCRRWRQLAVDCPTLWTYLELDVDRHGTHVTDRQCVFKTGLYLGRSKDHSLFVVLYGDMTDHAVIPVLEVTTLRWENLATMIPMRALQSFSGNIFPRLSVLEVSYPPGPNPRTADVDTFTSIDAPLLRHVYTRNPSWNIFNDVQIPWKQLYKISELAAFDVRAIHCLRKCSELDDLEINVASTYCTLVDGSISLPKLISLIMHETAAAESGRSKEFLEHFSVPDLTSLTLNYPVDLDSRRIQFPDIPKLVGAAEKLTMLELCCAMNAHADNTQSLLAFLSLVPNTEYFQLRDLGVTAQFFSGMKKSTLPSRLPRLRVLNISDCCYEDECIPLILDMFESRCNRKALAAPTELGNDATPQDSCLETAVVPRSLYFQPGERWEVIRTALDVQHS